MTTEIIAFVTSVAHITKVAKALFQARDEVKRTEIFIELNGALADTQTKHLAVIQGHQKLVEANESLKKQLDSYDKWEHEKSRYRLENVGYAAVVYALNSAVAGGEAPHWICAHCYQTRKKGFFQAHGKVNHFKCDGCGLEIDALKTFPSAKQQGAPA